MDGSTLTEAADLTITLAANGSSLVPAFSLYAGQQQTDNGGNGGWHVYNNAGNFDWSTADPTYDSSSLNYIGNASAAGTDSRSPRPSHLLPVCIPSSSAAILLPGLPVVQLPIRPRQQSQSLLQSGPSVADWLGLLGWHGGKCRPSLA
ncbi:MAG: hypothetical protein U0361_23485 [Nitrospiraceae bacterium]